MNECIYMNSTLFKRQFLGSSVQLFRSITFQTNCSLLVNNKSTRQIITPVIVAVVNYKCYSTTTTIRPHSTFTRNYHNWTVRASMSTNSVSKVNGSDLRERYKPRDIKFKNPYGHVACMEWGNPNAPHKILCMHGWLDNAGSFERLVPYILDHGDNADKYHIVAMDQPGVGLSSHLPSGTFYTQYSSIVEMKRIIRELKWDKLTLLSHSLGSHLSFMYACIYPHQVESILSIDLAHPLAVQVQNWNISIANSIDEYFKYENDHEDDPNTNSNTRIYSESEAIKRLMDSHSNSLTRESAETLFKRGARRHGSGGFTFARDLRLRFLTIESKLTDDLMIDYMSEPFKVNLLIMRANRSPYHRPDSLRLKYYDLFTRNCPIFRDVILDGTHHLHMNTPEIVAPEVNKFLDDVRARSDVASATKSQKSNL